MIPHGIAANEAGQLELRTIVSVNSEVKYIVPGKLYHAQYTSHMCESSSNPTEDAFRNVALYLHKFATMELSWAFGLLIIIMGRFGRFRSFGK